MLYLLIVFLASLIAFSAFFSASEAALFSLPSTKVKVFRTDKDPRKQLVAQILSTPRDLLITIIILNVIVNILIQNVTSSIFGDFSGWLFTILTPLVLTVVFGEVFPKSIGLANNVAFSYRVAPILNRAQKLLLPLRRVLGEVTNIVSRILFFYLKPEEEISSDELRHALKTSRSFEILNEEEAELVRGYLHLQEAQVRDSMRPREEVIFYNLEDPLSKLIHLFVDQECSRIPVCRENLDKVLGVITGQLFFLHRDKINKPEDILPILVKPFFVPESTPASILIRQMYNRRESLALVVDEYGSISGLIALEDLVETVIGEIADARDTKSHYTRSGNDILIASGKLELSEFEEIFGVTLPSENNRVTLGGWLTEQLGDIPKPGTKATLHGFFFHVLAADVKRVRMVYVRKLQSKKDEEK
ncbi:MAG TPA: hemolysin family protein [Rhabdochlamydiaceae bacterium]|jgi:CBS domain containing-hemolysin-like protein